jgi:threonine synthase
MRFRSTRGSAGEVGLAEAVFQGLAPGGGLYLPTSLPHVTPGPGWDELEGAVHLLGPFLDDGMERATVRDLLTETVLLPLPVRPLDDGIQVLELFHGPTGAFKDFGARFLAGLLVRLQDGRGGTASPGPLRILTATSGDTGGAVAHAVAEVKRRGGELEAVILFPEEGVTPVQRRQMTGGAGGPLPGVRAVAVTGTFDDCQRMVKAVLSEPGPRIPGRLTSANSVNIARLLPQMLFYLRAWQVSVAAGEPSPLVSIPSGNLGNLTAAVMARRMGLPLGPLISAGNRNGALEGFLRTGAEPDGTSVSTPSSAMDVARPSNLERLVALYEHDRERMAGEIRATTHGDMDTLDAMHQVHRRTGYLMDPHTAVGWLGIQEARRQGLETPAILLATADPGKFPETVARAVGKPPPERWPEEERGGDAGGEVGVDALPPDPDALRRILAE